MGCIFGKFCVSKVEDLDHSSYHEFEEGGYQEKILQNTMTESRYRDTQDREIDNQIEQLNIKNDIKKTICLEDFIKIKNLGRGSFGTVDLVKRQQDQKLYAMKTIKKSRIKTDKQKRHTQTERIILERIHFPFIVKLQFAFQTQQCLHLIIDYMNSGELFQYLKVYHIFKENIAQFYAAEILLGLEHLHSQNIIYRDLKPENVLLDDQGHIKLTDFGLSFILSKEIEYTNSMCGTPDYVAPEILLNTGHDKTVDWWSFGVLLYEMLVGKPPFYSQDKKQQIREIIQKEVNIPQHLSVASQEILRGLLQKNPEQRLGYGFQDAQPIKEHIFFEGINWDDLLELKVSSPLKAQKNDYNKLELQMIQKQSSDDLKQNLYSPNEMQNFSNFTYLGKQTTSSSESDLSPIKSKFNSEKKIQQSSSDEQQDQDFTKIIQNQKQYIIQEIEEQEENI